jgi:hypothetical protein
MEDQLMALQVETINLKIGNLKNIFCIPVPVLNLAFIHDVTDNELSA